MYVLQLNNLPWKLACVSMGPMGLGLVMAENSPLIRALCRDMYISVYNRPLPSLSSLPCTLEPMAISTHCGRGGSE